MGRKEENGVGKPGEQKTSREIRGIQVRIEERIGEKGGEWSVTARTRKSREVGRIEARREESTVMGRKEKDGVGKPGEQGTSREIGGIEARI